MRGQDRIEKKREGKGREEQRREDTRVEERRGEEDRQVISIEMYFDLVSLVHSLP